MIKRLTRHPAEVALVLALLATIILWLVYPHVFIASDPWDYSLHAYGMAHGTPLGDPSVSGHRPAVFAPASLIYRWFGVNMFTTNVWPLCTTLLIVVVIWAALPDTRSKVFGALLCLVSVPLFRASTQLLPDVTVTAFMAASALALFSRKRFVHTRGLWLMHASGFVCLLFAAFLAKATAYWILPLWGIALVQDAREEQRAALLRRFHLPALIGGLLLGGGYLVICQIEWGDSLARFKSIQALTGQHLWAMERAPAGALVKRLTVDPARLFADQYGAIMALAVLGVFVLPKAIAPWGWYTILCVGFFWFGSTSFTRYEPMPVEPRMILPALPGLYVLAAHFSSRLALASGRRRIDSLFPYLLVLALAGLPFARYVNSWRWIDRGEQQAMCIVRSETEAHPEREYLVVCSDSRSPDALAFYFGYEFPNNVSTAFLGDLGPDLVTDRNLFVFAHENRSHSLQKMYGFVHYDEGIHALGLPRVCQSEGISLYHYDREDAGSELLRMQKPVAIPDGFTARSDSP